MRRTRSLIGFLILVLCFVSCTNQNTKYYSVSYESDYGSVPESIRVEEHTILSADQLPILSSDYYIFDGWYDGETKVEAERYQVTKDITLKAKWTVIKYTIKYETEYGGTPESITVTVNTILTSSELPILSTDAYIFDGWYDEEKKVEEGVYKVTKDVTLIAKWEDAEVNKETDTTESTEVESEISEDKETGKSQTDNTTSESSVIDSDSNENKENSSTQTNTTSDTTTEENDDTNNTQTEQSSSSSIEKVNYSVKHFQQNIDDDEYVEIISDLETKEGIPDEQTVAVAKTYAGFVAKTINQQTINSDGSTVVNIYYDRVVTTYTFDPDGGNWDGSTANQTISKRYGAIVSVTQPTKDGYIFVSWNQTVPQTFGDTSLNFRAIWDVAPVVTKYKWIYMGYNSVLEQHTTNVDMTSIGQTDYDYLYYTYTDKNNYKYSAIVTTTSSTTVNGNTTENESESRLDFIVFEENNVLNGKQLTYVKDNSEWVLRQENSMVYYDYNLSLLQSSYYKSYPYTINGIEIAGTESNTECVIELIENDDDTVIYKVTGDSGYTVYEFVDGILQKSTGYRSDNTVSTESIYQTVDNDIINSNIPDYTIYVLKTYDSSGNIVTEQSVSVENVTYDDDTIQIATLLTTVSQSTTQTTTQTTTYKKVQIPFSKE